LNRQFNDTDCENRYDEDSGKTVPQKEEGDYMIPVINKVRTGKLINLYMNMRGLTVKDVADRLSLGCVQSVYHWLSGRSLPSLDNLYALSRILKVPIDAPVSTSLQPWL